MVDTSHTHELLNHDRLTQLTRLSLLAQPTPRITHAKRLVAYNNLDARDGPAPPFCVLRAAHPPTVGQWPPAAAARPVNLTSSTDQDQAKQTARATQT